MLNESVSFSLTVIIFRNKNHNRSYWDFVIYYRHSGKQKQQKKNIKRFFHLNKLRNSYLLYKLIINYAIRKDILEMVFLN